MSILAPSLLANQCADIAPLDEFMNYIRPLIKGAAKGKTDTAYFGGPRQFYAQIFERLNVNPLDAITVIKKTQALQVANHLVAKDMYITNCDDDFLGIEIVVDVPLETMLDLK